MTSMDPIFHEETLETLLNDEICLTLMRCDGISMPEVHHQMRVVGQRLRNKNASRPPKAVEFRQLAQAG
ncbi:hypothetical protein JCM17844_07760 [Iodidimonas gelatinilytica]|uniref:Uncharacterized protein n=2 Tax=Iodidimonas TaxID=2066486 RepID=A0A5A7MU33_9PROT|nr:MULTISPECIES: hypothetical protein [Iodidimonas]GEQ97139.1 hypothetical protein JCM17844_07760 [Iodidimonas gelatinilytica]GEQ99470.1 hypothetical protein JCM17845_00940 [Iodidimonas gelatinilytica]GER07432.1 hypothetical protein JCM17843_17420 [Kordiimonadales bacterium JCM 17843]GGO10539.1 hypothetical protein GCM10007972_13420 [Iodidimonas muriae]